MNNIYFMCENCGIETNGITFVNGMKFCAKCYHQIFGKDNQQTEITQLKQQLAEKQKTIDEINKEFVQAVHDWKTLCAEKDKEIEKLKTKQKPIVMHSKENYYFLEEENIKLHFAQKQLAIQELEKVKNKCNGMYELWLDSNYKENMYNNEDIAGVFEDISVFTNDLIKKLKGE